MKQLSACFSLSMRVQPAHLTRGALLQRLLVALPATLPWALPFPAAALLGEVTGDGFTQADDKSWDFRLPSNAWKITDPPPFRNEHPTKLFHATGGRSGGDAKFDLSVDPSGAKSLSDLGSPQAFGEKMSAAFAPASSSLESAKIVPGAIRGSQYFELVYRAPTVTTTTRLTAKQGRTYSFTVSVPDKASKDTADEAAALLDSFKAFPVNIICISQSSGGTSPVPGSCY